MTLFQNSKFCNVFRVVIFSTLNLLAFSCIECKPISGQLAKSLPVVHARENIEITRKIEIRLGVNSSTPAECSTTDDDFVPMQPKNGKTKERYRWKNFNVYADPEYNEDERTLINNAMVRLQQVLPCVNFNLYSDDPPEGDYIHVKKKSTCSSKVGKRGGMQEMKLGPKCMDVGTIMHEMIHALGFYHEHCRPDRDDHIKILWQNIKEGKSHNFDKKSSSKVSTFGVAYNTRSIMHYGSRDFSRNGERTIKSKDGSRVGSTGELQTTDIEKLNAMYKC